MTRDRSKTDDRDFKIEREDTFRYEEVEHLILYMDGETETVTFHRAGHPRGFDEVNGVRTYHRIEPSSIRFGVGGTPHFDTENAASVVVPNVRRFETVREEIVEKTGTYTTHVSKHGLKRGDVIVSVE